MGGDGIPAGINAIFFGGMVGGNLKKTVPLPLAVSFLNLPTAKFGSMGNLVFCFYSSIGKHLHKPLYNSRKSSIFAENYCSQLCR